MKCDYLHASIECDQGTYGVNCKTTCGGGCVDNNCHPVDGQCDCQKWWVEDGICDTEVTGEQKDMSLGQVQNTRGLAMR